MQKYNFKKDSESAFIESQMRINSDGVSDWYSVIDLNKKAIQAGFKPIRGNGSPIFQKDRGFGKKYELEKSKNSRGGLEHIRTTGFSSYFSQNRGINIPKAIRDKLRHKACVNCGSRHAIEIDHCNGRKAPNLDINEDAFQPLCKHCNLLKRDRCKNCEKTGLRFDAKQLGYNISYLKGGKYYAGAKEGCEGCYMYKPLEFKQILHFPNIGS